MPYIFLLPRNVPNSIIIIKYFHLIFFTHSCSDIKYTKSDNSWSSTAEIMKEWMTITMNTGIYAEQEKQVHLCTFDCLV